MTGVQTCALPISFIHEEYAAKIFTDWIATVGRDDKNDDIRVALVEGDIPGEENGYYVIIGSNIDEALKRAEKQEIPSAEMLLLNVSRIIRANPTDNLLIFNMFKQDYQKAGEYILMPAIIDERSRQIKHLPQYSIHKRKLIYRDIKDINEHDEDAILLAKNKPWTKRT